MAKRFGFFQGFKKSILSGFVHGVGWTNDKIAVMDFFIIGEGDKFANLFYGDKFGSFIIRGR
jgi:hypothetical protein